MCGGYYAMSVYANDEVDSVDPVPVEPEEPTDSSYMGCYADMPDPER